MATPKDISNEELMRRLKLFNYSAPPITPSTRGVLLKKLTQLETEAKQRQQKGRSKGSNGGSAYRLLDYSSGEEDASVSSSVSSGVRRRATLSVPIRVAPSTPSSKSSISSSSTNGHTRASTSTSTSARKSVGRLMNYSENEDDDDDEQDDHLVEDDEDEEDEEEDEEDEEEDEEDDDDVDHSFAQKSFSVQTSPRLDISTPSTSILVDNNLVTPDSNARFGVRFKSSTPMAFSKATPSSTTTTSMTSTRILRGHPSTTSTSSLQSPLRRAIAQNDKAFGSLGEALDSLPGRSGSSSTSSNSSSGSGNSSNGSTKSSASSVVTSVSRESAKMESFNKRPTGFCSSHVVSKLIIFVVSFFFLCLAYKYTTLRPTIDVMQRLPVCKDNPNEDTRFTCVPGDQLEAMADLYKEIVSSLDNAQDCNYAPDSRSAPAAAATISLEQLRRDLVGDQDEFDDSYDSLKEQESRAARWNLLQLLTKILEENQKLGITVTRDSDGATTLAVTQPHVPWSCWVVDKIYLTYTYGTALLWWALVVGTVSLVVYAGYRFYVWYQEKLLREKQDVFELVEQVLSLLVNQHQAAARAGGGRISQSYVAINHVRDQLIPPQDRKRKRKLWEKVATYIRESESRVREEVQVVYGEENRVWRWIPDMTWGTPINPHGPNPYVVSPVVTAASSSGFPPAPVPPFITPNMTPTTSTVSPASGNPGNGSWQGSAFSSLNKNVAAPSVAPTSCLKVRHMFDRRAMLARHRGNNRAWVVQLRDEIVTRCAMAAILHIAVDTESPEGCVYIKARTTEDAHKIFNCLHGQWYAGSLVTVKYMREERYHERFPDSRHQVFPLRVDPTLKPL